MNRQERETILKQINSHNFEELNKLKFEFERILQEPNLSRISRVDTEDLQRMVNEKINTLL